MQVGTVVQFYDPIIRNVRGLGLVTKVHQPLSSHDPIYLVVFANGEEEWFYEHYLEVLCK